MRIAHEVAGHEGVVILDVSRPDLQHVIECPRQSEALHDLRPLLYDGGKGGHRFLMVILQCDMGDDAELEIELAGVEQRHALADDA